MKQHAIKLVNEKEPSYGYIYILNLVEFKNLNTYIKTFWKLDLPNFQVFDGAFILFDKKHYRSFYLYINYHSLNFFSLKNRYFLSFIRESLDWLSQAKHFIHFKRFYIRLIRGPTFQLPQSASNSSQRNQSGNTLPELSLSNCLQIHHDFVQLIHT